MIYQYKDTKPKIAEDAFVAPTAVVIGDVSIGRGSGIWFGSVVRGDVHYIRIGDFTNIQDQSMLHVTGGKFPLTIGSYCTLGHRATVHGCILKDHAFIGMGATVLDGAVVEEFALVAAGALVPPGKRIPSRMLAMGTPAKVVREITKQEEEMILATPNKYASLAQDYRRKEGFSVISEQKHV